MQDKAILVTSSKSYALQRREYSNLFLFGSPKIDLETEKNILELRGKPISISKISYEIKLD